MAIGRKCDPEKWNNVSCQKIGVKAGVREFNAYLDPVRSKVYEIHRRLIAKGEEFTAENSRDILSANPLLVRNHNNVKDEGNNEK